MICDVLGFAASKLACIPARHVFPPSQRLRRVKKATTPYAQAISHRQLCLALDPHKKVKSKKEKL